MTSFFKVAILKNEIFWPQKLKSIGLYSGGRTCFFHLNDCNSQAAHGNARIHVQ